MFNEKTSDFRSALTTTHKKQPQGKFKIQFKVINPRPSVHETAMSAEM